MSIIGSAYNNTEEEYQQVFKFISSVYSHTQKMDDFTLSRLEIWFYEHFFQDTTNSFFTLNCHLWKHSSNEIVGLFVSEDGENGFHLITHPEHFELIDSILSWVFDVWAVNKNSLWTELVAFKTQEIDLYGHRGFKKTEEYSISRVYDLEQFDESLKLPAGFSVASADEKLDVSGHVELIKNAFDKDFYSSLVYEKLREASSYSAELDISVYTPEGVAVATCTGWVDVNNKVAEIETVGTHRNYRQRGLARAVMTTCLRRLKEQGYISASISSFNDITHSFYDSFAYKERIISFEYVWNKQK